MLFRDLKSAAQVGILVKRRSADSLNARKFSVEKGAKKNSPSTHIDSENRRTSDESSAPAHVPVSLVSVQSQKII